MAAHVESTFRAMNIKRKSNELCDFTIKVGAKSFPVHRIVLSSCSEYFRAMFSSDMKEAKQGFCEIKDSEVNAVKECIEFMYTGEANIAMDNVEIILHIAEMWQLNLLKQKCADILSENIDKEFCITVKQLSKLYELKRVEENVDNFIAKNLQKLHDETRLIQVDEVDLVSYMEMARSGDIRDFNDDNDEMETHEEAGSENTADEGLFWEIVVDWIKHGNSETRAPRFCDLIKNIRLTYLTTEYISNVVWQEPLVKECEACKAYTAKVFLEDITEYRKPDDVFGRGFTHSEKHQDPYIFIKCLARDYGNEQIENDADQLIIENFHLLADSSELPNFHINDMKKYLQSYSNGQQCTSGWKALLNWINCDRYEVHFTELFMELNLQLIPFDFIVTNIWPNELVKSSNECRDHLFHHMFQTMGEMQKTMKKMEEKFTEMSQQIMGK